MRGNCRDCRFYDGSRCEKKYGILRSSYDSCPDFASNTRSSSNKCGDCRFYDGHRCKKTGNLRTSYDKCPSFSPYR